MGCNETRRRSSEVEILNDDSACINLAYHAPRLAASEARHDYSMQVGPSDCGQAGQCHDERWYSKYSISTRSSALALKIRALLSINCAEHSHPWPVDEWYLSDRDDFTPHSLAAIRAPASTQGFKDLCTSLRRLDVHRCRGAGRSMRLIADEGNDHAVQVEEEHDQVEAQLDE